MKISNSERERELLMLLLFQNVVNGNTLRMISKQSWLQQNLLHVWKGDM